MQSSATGAAAAEVATEPGQRVASSDASPEDLARAGCYRLFATLLARSPTAGTLATLAELNGQPSPFGDALGLLGIAARDADPNALGIEFDKLFIGVGEGELVPYGSYYITGFLHERPLARLRADMQALGIERAEGVAEPEDGMASLCEIMAGVIAGAFGPPMPLAEQKAFFATHIQPWAARFFADLEEAPSAQFYKTVGRAARLFIEIESESFTMTGMPVVEEMSQ